MNPLVVLVRRRRAGSSVRLVALAGLVLVAGCSDSVSVVPGLPGIPVPDLVRVVKDVDRPANAIDRALSDCDRGRTVAGETACVKQALAAGHIDAAALARMVPACRIGTICRYRYTTVDRVGFVPATESNYTVQWRVDFDLRKPAKTAEDIPVSVSVI